MVQGFGGHGFHIVQGFKYYLSLLDMVEDGNSVYIFRLVQGFKKFKDSNGLRVQIVLIQKV